MGVGHTAAWVRRVAVVALAVGSLALASASPAWATTTQSSSAQANPTSSPSTTTQSSSAQANPASSSSRKNLSSTYSGKSNPGGEVITTAPSGPGGGNGSGTPGSPGATHTPPSHSTIPTPNPPSGNTNSAPSTTDLLTAYYNNCSSTSVCNSPDCTPHSSSGSNGCRSSTPPNQGCVGTSRYYIVGQGRFACSPSTPPTTPTTTNAGWGPGTPDINQVGWGPNYPSPECALNWSTSYGGATYPMSGDQCAGPVTTGWIKAVCNGSQTSGTVSFDISEWGQVPGGGPYVPEGPYTSSFTVPSCSPAAQENPVSITWQVKGPHYPNDTVNGQGIAVNWRLVPVVSPLGLDVPIAPDLGPTIHWNGFSSGPTVTNYAKNQILGPNTQALIGHTLPQWITTGSEPNQIISAANSGHSAPVVTGKFYVRTFKGRPMNIEVTGSYTAIWGHWYFKVTAIPTAYQATYPYKVLVAPGYWFTWCSSYKYTSTGLKCTSINATWVPPVYDPVTFYYPTGVSPSISNVNLVPLSAHKETFPVSADIKVRTYRAVVTAGG